MLLCAKYECSVLYLRTKFKFFSLVTKFKCSVLSLWTKFKSFCARLAPQSCRLFSRDVTAWLFRLYWILFPDMSQLVISSLLKDSNVCCALFMHHSLPLDSSPEMLPSGYFVSTGFCFQRCPKWLFCLFWRIPMYLCSLRAPQSPLRLFSRDVTVWLFRLYWILFPEMSQVAISSLLEDSNVFVISSCTTVSLRLKKP